MKLKRADIGVYDGHEYGAKGLVTFTTEEDYEFEGRLIPEGSVFDGEMVQLFDGEKDLGVFCCGWHDFGPATLWIEVPEEICAEYDEDDDPVAAWSKQNYEAEFAKDKKGCLPFQFIHFAIRDNEAALAAEKSSPFASKYHVERLRRWLDALHAYRQKHYGDTEP